MNKRMRTRNRCSDCKYGTKGKKCNRPDYGPVDYTANWRNCEKYIPKKVIIKHNELASNKEVDILKMKWRRRLSRKRREEIRKSGLYLIQGGKKT